MSYKKTILVALGAFVLGFGFSEYRHANQDSDAQQMAGHLPEPISVQPALDRPSAPSQVSSVPNTNAQEYLPSRPQTPLERANQLIANGSYGEAARVLNQLLEQEPKNTEALWLLARVYEQQGQHKESVAIWFRYIRSF